MNELRKQYEAKIGEALAVVNKAVGEGREMTADEEKQHDAFIAEADKIEARIKTQEKAAELRDRLESMAPASQTPAPVHVEVEQRGGKPEPGDALGALVVARFKYGNNIEEARKWAATTYGERSTQARALQQTVFTSGGATLAENFVGQELIEYLRAKAAVRRAGARQIPLVNGSATLPRVTGGATAYWGAEGDNITASEQTTDQITLTEKKLTCLVPLSNDLLKNSNIAVERMVRDDMVTAAANAEDLAFLKGPGTSGQPKGIYYWVPAAGRGNSAGTSLANIRTDVKTAKNRLGNNNAPMQKRAWFMHSRGINYIGTEIVDANSNLVWPSMADGDGAKWNGGTVYEDNNISITLGSGDKSEVYYVEMSECFIGDNGSLELELFANATYVDSGGSTRSGISRDESVVRLIRKADFAMRHDVSAYVLEAVSYGA